MIPRERYLKKIEAGFRYNPVVILSGARQVGKTTLMEMFMKNRKGLWLNGQNPDEAGLFEKFAIIERYLKLNINEAIDGWLMIDEFQYINGISVSLKLLTDKYKSLKVLCSGSSSLGILQEVEESLAGRMRMIPVYPLSFSEYLLFVNPELAQTYVQCGPADDINTLFPQARVLLNEYLTYGGLPKVALADSIEEKEELLNDIFQTYLLKDVRQFVRNQDFVAFNKLLRILSAQTGNLLNINELSSLVQLPYKACEEYVHLLRQMFIIHLVPPFSQNKRKEISKMPKVYFCDHGLRNMVYNSFNDMEVRTDSGAIFENYVFLELLQHFKSEQLFFYRTKDGTEIDFIISDRNRGLIPVEAKFKKLKNPLKVRALTEFGKNHPFQLAIIVNRSLIARTDNQHFIQPWLGQGLP